MRHATLRHAVAALIDAACVGVNDANIKCIIIATAIGAGATQRRPTRARVHTSTQILLFKSSAAFLLTVSMSAPTNLLII